MKHGLVVFTHFALVWVPQLVTEDFVKLVGWTTAVAAVAQYLAKFVTNKKQPEFVYER